jgi:hypothetical protein
MNKYLVITNNSISETNTKKDVKGVRYIDNIPYNSELEELKMSVRIAKFNYKIDTGNKYYKEQLEKAEIRLKKHLETRK